MRALKRVSYNCLPPKNCTKILTPTSSVLKYLIMQQLNGENKTRTIDKKSPVSRQN